MSTYTGDHHTDEVVEGLIAGFQRLMRQARGLIRGVRRLLGRPQRRRMMMEHWARQAQWNPTVDAQRQQQTGPERTQQAEYAARLAEERDALLGQRDNLQGRVQDLQQQADQARQDREAADAQQRGSDEYRNRIDGNDNGIDDNQDADNRLDEQNQRTEDQQEIDRREDQQAREDDDRRKREEEQSRNGREEADTGVGPGEVAGAAAGAAIAAEEIDEQLDNQDDAQNGGENEAENVAGDADSQQAQADNEQQAEADNEQQAEADNEQGAGTNATNDTERDQAADQAVNPEQQADAGVENAAVDPTQNADQQLDQEATGEPSPSVTDTSLDGQEAANTDVENAAPGVDQQVDAEVENAAADPSQAADNQLQADSAEQGTNPYATDSQLEADSAEPGATPEAAEAGQQQDGQSLSGDNAVAAGQGGLDNGQQNVVEWDTERDGTHINATGADPNTVYRIQPGQSVSLSYSEGGGQDSPGQDSPGQDGLSQDGLSQDGLSQDRPGMDGQDAGRGADSNRESINIGDISGNQTFVVDQSGVHQGVQEGDRIVAQGGRQAEQGQQPRETMEQPAFPTAGDAAEANRVEQQSMEGTQQGGQNAQTAAQVAGRDAQEKPVLDGLRAENAENRAKNPPGRAQTEMSADEIGQQQHQVNAGRPSAAGAPGYDSGELANSGASGGQREYADRARNQGSRGSERGNDGPGLGK